MASPPGPLSGKLSLGNHREVNFVTCMSTKCLHCGNIIVGDGLFIALGDPYCGVVHQACAPYYAYPPAWPHPRPAIAFTSPPHP
jgi:hypothetical protein